MRKKIKSRWPFTKTDSKSDLSTPQKPSASDSASWSIYQQITELPLSRWIDVNVDGYLRALAKSGTPPEIELLGALANLRVQYADAMGDAEYGLYCGVMREITRLEITLAQIENLITTLREAYHPVLARRLNTLLNHQGFNWPDEGREEIDRLLTGAWRRSRSIVLHIALKRGQLEKLKEKYSGTGQKPTREYYMGMLISLSDDAGYPLSDNITVWEFCERIRRANKKVEQLNAQLTKHGGRTH